MHGREGFTLAQYEAAVDLAMFLKEKEIGSVRVCDCFQISWENIPVRQRRISFTCFRNDGVIKPGKYTDNRQWEVDALFTEENVLSKLDVLHNDLVVKASTDILDWPKPESFIETPDLLER